MLQQINLYEPIFREDHKLFSATAICVALGVVAAALVAISAFSEWRTHSLDRQLLALHGQEAARKKFVAEATAIVDLAESHDTIENHLKAMAIELGRRQQALRYLRGGDLAATGDGVPAHRGFVGRMTALARQQVDGLWLTGATFVSGSGGLELTGGAVSADLVPIYLERLAGEPAIAGTKLQTIDIRQPKKPNRADIEFTVSTKSSP
jgi:Fimbrial assembly protein (PilN)